MKAGIITALAFALIASPGIAKEEEPTVTNLQCHGTYNNLNNATNGDASLENIRVEVGAKQVKVSGAHGFNETYTITNNSQSGITFHLASDPRHGGTLSLSSGELLLDDNADKMRAHGEMMVTAFCNKTTHF